MEEQTQKKVKITETDILVTARFSTDIIFILDNSGSMENQVNNTCSGFNELISSQKKLYSQRIDDENCSVDCSVTLIKFSNHDKINTIYEKKDINDIEYITKTDLLPTGLTALYDAMAYAFEINFEPRRKRTYVVITDGENNDSINHNPESIKNKIEKFDKDNVSVLYIGSNQDSIINGKQMGVDKNHSLNYKDGQTPTIYRCVSKVLTRTSIGNTPTSVFSDQDVEEITNDIANINTDEDNLPNNTHIRRTRSL
jgi:hypothetical protein